MSAAVENKPAGAVEAPPYTPGAVVLDVFGEEDEPPGGWDAPPGGVFELPPAHERLHGFLGITAVQQTLVLFLGSLAYDAGSIAYVPPRVLLAGVPADCALHNWSLTTHSLNA